MKLIKINECNFTVDEKYFIPNNYELKCRLASKTRPVVYEVDQTFFTDSVKEAEYEIEGDLVRIAFPVNDVITEVYLNQSSGEVKVQFEYLPTELDKTEAVKFLQGVLEKRATMCCDTCKYKHKYILLGSCGWVYWD